MRELSHKTLFTAMPALVLFCLLIYSDTFFGETSDTPSSAVELSDLMGMDLEEAADLYDMTISYNTGCNDYMQIIAAYDYPIFLIRLWETDQYTLCGIHSLMDIEEAGKKLLEEGFEPTRTEYVYVLKEKNWYLDIGGINTSRGIILQEAVLPDPGEKIDLAVYLGKDLSEVERDFPDMALDRSEEEELGCVYYYNKELWFTAERREEKYIVSYIKITGDSEKTCLDGFTVLDNPYCYEENKFALVLGSGEWYDPLHGVVFCQRKAEGDTPGFIGILDYTAWNIE